MESTPASSTFAEQYRNMRIDDPHAGSSSEDGVVVVLPPGISSIQDLQWTMVGRFLTDRPVNFNAMKSTLANLWRPLKGVRVSLINPNLFLFKFFHVFDYDRMVDSGPWTFDGKLLVWTLLQPGVSPTSVPLTLAAFWLQIYNLPFGFLTEDVGRQLGNTLGRFLRCDATFCSGGWSEYLRIRVELDITLPLRAHLRIKQSGGDWVQAPVKYERLPQFCFFCGVIGHTEFGCHAFFQLSDPSVPKPYSEALRAPGRRSSVQAAGSPWLRDSSADSNFALYPPQAVMQDSRPLDPGLSSSCFNSHAPSPQRPAQSPGFVHLVHEMDQPVAATHSRALTSSSRGSRSSVDVVLIDPKRKRHVRDATDGLANEQI